MTVEDEASGAHAGYVKILRDITRRRNRDAELLESDARLRLAVDAARTAIWDYDVASDRPDIKPNSPPSRHPEEDRLDVEKVRARYWPGDRESIRAGGRGGLAWAEP